jgi:hypothetical protein
MVSSELHSVPAKKTPPASLEIRSSIMPPHDIMPPFLPFFNSNSGGDGVQLGSLGTAATNWPIVPTAGDYKDEKFCRMMVGRRNRSTREKPAPVPLCPPRIPHDLNGREPGPLLWETTD